MANRVPLIVDTSTLNIKELPAGDSLDLTNSGIVNAGVITASSFSGNISGTPTLGTGVTITSSGINVTGVITASNGFSGDLTGDVTGAATQVTLADESSDTTCFPIFATGATGNLAPKTGTNLTFNSSTGDLTVGGNVSVGGTLTYQDVRNVDSIGIITAQNGLRVTAGGINVTAGISTFGALVDVNNRIDVVGGANIDQVNVSGVSTYGGNVDINANVDVSGTISITGVDIDLGSNGLDTGDNKGLKFGDGDDFLIYHKGGGTGPNVIDNAGDDCGGLEIRHGTEVQAKFVPDGEVILYHNDIKRFETRTDGAAVVGILTASGLNIVTGVSTFASHTEYADAARAKFGASSDLQVYHDSGTNYIKLGVVGAELKIEGTAETLATFTDDGSCVLRHNNGTRITTTLDGTDIGGTGAVGITKGTTGQRPGSSAAGDFRYNTTTEKFEGYTTKWGDIGGGTEEVDNIVSQTTATGVGTMAVAEYRAASIRALIQQGTNYQVGRYLMIHDNSTVTVVEESAVATGSMLGSFDGVISGGNAVLRVTMVSAASTAVVTTLIDKITI